MIPYSRQCIDSSDIREVNKVLKSDFITQGPIVNQFEISVARYCNSKFAVAVNSATSALHIACKAIGVSENDYVWTVPNSFVASANCALYCNAKIDFVDIDNYTWNVSIIKLKEKLKIAKIKKTLPKVFISVHLAGNPPLQNKIYQLSKEYKFKIIEDASHSLGSSFKNEKVGNCKWSNICVFSFHPVKMITTGEGGIATTNDNKLFKKMRMYASHGITKSKLEFKSKKTPPWHYEQHYLGFNYRLTDIQAALGISQLKKIDLFVKKRNKIANFYKTNFKKINVDFQKIENDVICSYHLFIIKINKKYHHKKHINLFKYLLANQIGVNIHYQPIHLQPYFQKLGFRKGDFPIAEKYPNECISIPIYPQLTVKNAQFVFKLIKSFLSD